MLDPKGERMFDKLWFLAIKEIYKTKLRRMKSNTGKLLGMKVVIEQLILCFQV